jgi:hypothetical protein
MEGNGKRTQGRRKALTPRESISRMSSTIKRKGSNTDPPFPKEEYDDGEKNAGNR